MTDELTATRALDDYSAEKNLTPEDQVVLLLEFIEFEKALDAEFWAFIEKKSKEERS